MLPGCLEKWRRISVWWKICGLFYNNNSFCEICASKNLSVSFERRELLPNWNRRLSANSDSSTYCHGYTQTSLKAIVTSSITRCNRIMQNARKVFAHCPSTQKVKTKQTSVKLSAQGLGKAFVFKIRMMLWTYNSPLQKFTIVFVKPEKCKSLWFFSEYLNVNYASNKWHSFFVFCCGGYWCQLCRFLCKSFCITSILWMEKKYANVCLPGFSSVSYNLYEKVHYFSAKINFSHHHHEFNSSTHQSIIGVWSTWERGISIAFVPSDLFSYKELTKSTSVKVLSCVVMSGEVQY